MFIINGERWQAVLVPPYSTALLMPNGDYAIGACNNGAKTIYISNVYYGEEFEEILCHELVHAAMFAYDVVLDINEEELIAQIIAVFGEEIIDLTDAIFDKIRRGRY